jgi:hypothetical protein
MRCGWVGTLVVARLHPTMIWREWVVACATPMYGWGLIGRRLHHTDILIRIDMGEDGVSLIAVLAPTPIF